MMRVVPHMNVSATPPVVLPTFAFRSIAPAYDAGAPSIVPFFGRGIALG